VTTVQIVLPYLGQVEAASIFMILLSYTIVAAVCNDAQRIALSVWGAVAVLAVLLTGQAVAGFAYASFLGVLVPVLVLSDLRRRG
jgi:hypothetical protein